MMPLRRTLTQSGWSQPIANIISPTLTVIHPTDKSGDFSRKKVEDPLELEPRHCQQTLRELTVGYSPDRVPLLSTSLLRNVNAPLTFRPMFQRGGVILGRSSGLHLSLNPSKFLRRYS